MKKITISNFSGTTVANVRLADLTEENKQALLQGEMLKNVTIYIEAGEFTVTESEEN